MSSQDHDDRLGPLVDLDRAMLPQAEGAVGVLAGVHQLQHQRERVRDPEPFLLGEPAKKFEIGIEHRVSVRGRRAAESGHLLANLFDAAIGLLAQLVTDHLSEEGNGSGNERPQFNRKLTRVTHRSAILASRLLGYCSISYELAPRPGRGARCVPGDDVAGRSLSFGALCCRVFFG